MAIHLEVREMRVGLQPNIPPQGIAGRGSGHRSYLAFQNILYPACFPITLRRKVHATPKEEKGSG